MHSFVLLRIRQQKSAASIVGHLKSEYASLAIILFLVFSFFFPVDKETSVRLIVAQMLCLRHFLIWSQCTFPSEVRKSV